MTRELSAELEECIKKHLKLKDVEPVIDVEKRKALLPYKDNVARKPALHIGQRKLFLAEMWHFLNVCQEKNFIIYVGGAPSMHMGYMMELLPNAKILLIDPNEFYIKFIEEKDGKAYMKSHYDGDERVQYLKGSKLNMYKEKERIINLMGKRVAVEDSNIKVDWGEAFKFMKKSPCQIFCYQDFMTNEVAAEIVKHCHGMGLVLFWSDIRTFGDKNSKLPGDNDLLGNMAMQEVWRRMINPDYSWFKFRYPFYDRPKLKSIGDASRQAFRICKGMGLDFVKNYEKKKFVYPDGELHLQTWAGHNSSEGRLIIKKGAPYREWTIPYDDIMFTWNNIFRCYTHHKNPKASKKYGFDHCGACAVEAKIWMLYEKLYKEEPKWLRNMEMISQKLRQHGHGDFFDQLTIEEIYDMIKKSKYYNV